MTRIQECRLKQTIFFPHLFAPAQSVHRSACYIISGPCCPRWVQPRLGGPPTAFRCHGRELACVCRPAKEASAIHRLCSERLVLSVAHGARCLALARASRRKNADAPLLIRPPTSMPSTTKQHLTRPAPRSSGYVRCLRAVACCNTRSARGRGCPSLCNGLTSVVSTATWAPRHTCRPFATTSIRRPSVARASNFISRSATCVATPPLLGICALLARSRGPALCARTPTCAQAKRWSPKASKRRPQRHRRRARGSGNRSLLGGQADIRRLGHQTPGTRGLWSGRS